MFPLFTGIRCAYERRYISSNESRRRREENGRSHGAYGYALYLLSLVHFSKSGGVRLIGSHLLILSCFTGRPKWEPHFDAVAERSV